MERKISCSIHVWSRDLTKCTEQLIFFRDFFVGPIVKVVQCGGLQHVLSYVYTLSVTPCIGRGVLVGHIAYNSEIVVGMLRQESVTRLKKSHLPLRRPTAPLGPSMAF